MPFAWGPYSKSNIHVLSHISLEYYQVCRNATTQQPRQPKTIMFGRLKKGNLEINDKLTLDGLRNPQAWIIYFIGKWMFTFVVVVSL